MRGDERLQGFCAHERSVAGKHQREFRAAEGALSDLHCVTCAILRLLQDRDGSQRLDDCRNLFCLMTYDHHRFARLERFTRANDVFYQGASASLVQDFRKAGLEASTSSRGEDNYG